ncbi:MAG: Ig-like domain-containing protein [Verrucomicrobiia bacterium]
MQWADAMDFMPSGNVLIYDAVSEIPLSGGGSFTGWTLFAVDLGTESISTIINLNEGLDFGNPSLGNVRTHLLTHEVIDRTSNVATIYAVDLRSGDANQIATLAQQNVLGFPAYTGDDRAIIYTQVDRSVPTTVSLFRQEVAADGITPVGQPTLWLADADYAAIYRRGDFVPTNALPQVSLTSPTPGQTFPVPASITVTANATDSDGSVERVQFFVGSSMIAETATAPYSTSFTVEEAPSGMLRLTARALDNLGGASDSAPVEVNVGGSTSTPITITAQPQSQTVAAGADATFRVAANGGRGPLTYRWRRNGVDLGATGPVLELQNVPVGAAGDYSVIISDGVASVTSAAATLTVTGGAVNGIRVQGELLAGGLVQLTISGGDIEDRLEVQSSPDLKAWTTLSTLVKTGESVSFVDSESSGAAMRFYRVRVRN